MTKEINYKDFVPEVIEKKFWTGRVYESLDEVTEKVNNWIRKNYQRRIINIETIVVPTNSNDQKKATNHRLNMGGGYVYMIQVIRVWYE